MEEHTMTVRMGNGSAHFITGDSLAEPPSSLSAQVAIASPPYAEQRKNTYGGVAIGDYPDFFVESLKKCFDHLAPRGSVFMNVKEHVNKGERSPYLYESVLRAAKEFAWVDEFIWVKTNPFPTGSKTRLKDGFERVYHFTRKGETPLLYPENVLAPSTSKFHESEKRRGSRGKHNTTNGSGMNMSRRSSPDMVRPSNVLTLSTSNENIAHPAVCPMGLPEFFVQLASREGDWVYCPFGGSGTVAIAAMKHGRHGVSVEKKAEYTDLAYNRAVRYAGQLETQPRRSEA